MAADYYELLGVSPSATDDEIRRAYRRLARELHPDANGGDVVSEARFKEVTAAYETLRDPERRRRYDRFGPEGARGSGGGDPFAGGGIGDIFEAFFGGANFGGGGFGGGGRANGPRRGEDAEASVDLTFEEAVFGAAREVAFRGHVVCTSCSGSGAKAGTNPITCLECAGTGQVRRVRQSILGQVVTTSACTRCKGIGEVIESPCSDCRGEGRILEEQHVTVEVPAGVDSGTTLRISGAGTAAFRGGIAGDLYVHLRVAPHERFERSGNDLLTDLHLAFSQAALGVEVTLVTLDGEEQLSIPAGTPSGKVVRLRGKGVPIVQGRGRGDLHVRVVVDTPTELTKEQDELLREFAQLRGEEVANPESGFISRIRSSFG